ncbi:hypothetical protein ZWY2020_051186 [Hordeum vulgare]|nr:hypothetical protein ZWY2020_051186 [Hordeum vulgare]
MAPSLSPSTRTSAVTKPRNPPRRWSTAIRGHQRARVAPAAADVPSPRAWRWSRGSLLPGGGAPQLAVAWLGGGVPRASSALDAAVLPLAAGRHGVRLAGGTFLAHIWALSGPIWVEAGWRFGAQRHNSLVVRRGGGGCGCDGFNGRRAAVWLLGLSGPVGVRPGLWWPGKSLSLCLVGSGRCWRLSPPIVCLAVGPEPGISSSSIEVSCWWP